MGFKINKAGWQQIAREVVETEGVARMRRVADAANDTLKRGTDGYRVSVEGDDQLTRRDYRATVITATPEAMASNAKNNTLVHELHRASGD